MKGTVMPSTDNSLAVFSYIGQDVRVVTADGDPWWVAADVADALGISNGRNMVARLDSDQKGVRLMDTLGGRQSLTVINESGLYTAIIRSDSPKATEFRRWVTGVVLPEIRRTGSYESSAPARTIPEDYASALRAIADEFEAHEATKAELAEVAPRADAWDAIASAKGDYAVGDAAKMLARAGVPTGPARLFGQLEALNWTFRGEGGRWRAYAERVEKGYLAERPMQHYHPKTGELVLDPPQLRVTIKGLERLRQRLHVGALQAVGS